MVVSADGTNIADRLRALARVAEPLLRADDPRTFATAAELAALAVLPGRRVAFRSGTAATGAPGLAIGDEGSPAAVLQLDPPPADDDPLLAPLHQQIRAAWAALWWRRRAAEADRATTARLEHAADLSHELRAPLTGIVGLAHLLLLHGSLTPEQTAHVEAIRQSGADLERLLDEFLDPETLGGESLRIAPQPFAPAAAVDGVLRLLRPRAEAKSLSLTAALDGLPERAVGDPLRLRQILINLVSNAIKYSDHGHIRVSAAPCPDAQERVRFTVSDNGAGIPEPLRDHLFDRQVRAADTAEAGCGLGLAIARRIVAALAGDIGVDSRPGLGATFWFEIPLPALPEAPASPPAPTAAGRRLRILVAENGAVDQQVLLGLLRWAGHRDVLVADGETALKVLETRAFDALLVDLGLPGINGLTLLHRLRDGGGGNADTPALAMTAGRRPGLTAECRAAGFTGLLIKPIEPASLLDALRRVTGAGGHGPWPDDGTGVGAGRVQGAASRLAMLEAMRGRAYVLETVRAFKDTTVTSLEVLRRHVADGNLGGTAEAAHELASAAGFFGLGPLSRAALAVEDHSRAGRAAEAFRLAGALPELLSDALRALDATYAAESVD